MESLIAAQHTLTERCSVIEEGIPIALRAAQYTQETTVKREQRRYLVSLELLGIHVKIDL